MAHCLALADNKKDRGERSRLVVADKEGGHKLPNLSRGNFAVNSGGVLFLFFSFLALANGLVGQGEGEEVAANWRLFHWVVVHFFHGCVVTFFKPLPTVSQQALQTGKGEVQVAFFCSCLASRRQPHS